MDRELEKAKKFARQIARSIEIPRFYQEKKREVERSRRLFSSSPLVRECLTLVREREDRIGHGIVHVRKVAIDAGAISLIENGPVLPMPEVRRMVLLAHIAGVLHDIRRMENDHARVSAGEAAKLLAIFDLSAHEVAAITGAIGNHEAFRPADPLKRPGGPVSVRCSLRCRQIPLGSGQFHGDALGYGGVQEGLPGCRPHTVFKRYGGD